MALNILIIDGDTTISRINFFADKKQLTCNTTRTPPPGETLLETSI